MNRGFLRLNMSQVVAVTIFFENKFFSTAVDKTNVYIVEMR